MCCLVYLCSLLFTTNTLYSSLKKLDPEAVSLDTAIQMLEDREKSPRRQKRKTKSKVIHNTRFRFFFSHCRLFNLTQIHPKVKSKTKPKMKRSHSPYIVFCSQCRKQVQSENPDASFGDIAKILGAKWKELSDSEKEQYSSTSSADTSPCNIQTS